MKKKSELVLLLGTLATGFLAVVSFSTPAPRHEANAALLAPPEHAEHFTFGYNESASDSLWLRLIQDIDHCDTMAKQRAEAKASGAADDAYIHCKSNLGWVYKMLDVITTLTPSFRMPYNHGATVLSITVGDGEGARRIFERGIQQFPKDWSLQYRAAYHYLYELNDLKRAADLLVQAGKNGAPAWVYSLAANIYTSEGKAALGKSVLQSVLEEDVDPKFAGRLKQRLEYIDSVLAKEKAEKSH